MTFADQLKAERDRLGITQALAADILSVSKRTYCAWEAGEVTPHRYMQTGAIRDLRSSDDHDESRKPSL